MGEVNRTRSILPQFENTFAQDSPRKSCRVGFPVATRIGQSSLDGIAILGSLALVLGMVSGIAYLVAFDLYVKSQSQQIGNEVRQIRIVIGTELREELRGTVEEPLQLLQDNGYNPERIWTRESLLRTRFQVFSSFLAMFLLITFGIGLLVPVSEVPTPRTSPRKNQTV
jgi:hypothetical protein